MNPYMNDRSVLMLRHLVRADAALGQAAEQLMFASTGMLEAIQPHPTEETSTMEWIINTVPGMQEMAMLSLGAPGSFNMGTLVLMLARARLRAYGDPILQVAAPLQAQLAATDLGGQLPARFFRCPYPAVYIELARPSPLRIVNRESGLHEVEAAYVTSHRIPPGARLREESDRVWGCAWIPTRRPGCWSSCSPALRRARRTSSMTPRRTSCSTARTSAVHRLAPRTGGSPSLPRPRSCCRGPVVGAGPSWAPALTSP
jgi:hypothetical protein